MQKIESVEETKNIKIKPAACPLGDSFCFESLGDYVKTCPFCSNFWIDTRQVDCKFNELSIEEQNLLLKLKRK